MKFLERPLKILLTLCRPFVAWLPAVLMVVLGAFYMVNCVQAALAPGRGFVFSYEGAKGPVLVRADSYSVDVMGRAAILGGVEVVSEGDQGRVSAKRAVVRQDREAWSLVLTEPSVELVRDAEGFFSALNLLPPPKEGAEPPVSEVSWDRLTILYRDEGVRPVVSQTLYVEEGRAVSAPSGLALRGDVVWPGSGVAALALNLPDDGGLGVELRTERFDLAPLWPLVVQLAGDEAGLRELGVSARQAVFEGEMSLFVPEEGAAEAMGAGTLTADDLDVRGYLAGATVRADLRADAGLVRGSVESTEARRRVVFEGGVSLGRELRLLGGVEVSARSTEDLWKEISSNLPPGLVGRTVVYRGSVDIAGERLATSGNLTAEAAVWEGQAVEGVSAQIHYSPDRFQAVLEKGTFEDYPFSGWVSLNLRSETIEGAFTGGSSELGPLLERFGVEGVALTGVPQVLVSGALTSPEATGSLVGSVTYSTGEQVFDLGVADFRVDYVDGTAVLERAALVGRYGVGKATGSVVDFGKNLNIAFEVGDLNLGLVQEGLSGFSVVKGTVTGSVDEPVVRGEASAFNVVYGDVKVPQAQAEIGFRDGVVQMNNLVVRLGLGRVVGAGEYRISDGHLDFEGAGNDLFIADYTQEPVFGQVDLTSLRVTGTLAEPVVTVEAEARDVLAYGVEVSRANLEGRFEGGVATVEALEAEFGGGSVSARGTYDLEAQSGTGSGSFEGVGLGALPVDRSVVELVGSASGTFTASMAGEVVSGGVEGDLSGLTINSLDIGPGQFRATVEEGAARFSMEAGSPQGYLAIEDGVYDLELRTVEARLVAGELEASGLWRSVEGNVDELDADLRRFLNGFEGRAAVETVVSGPVDDLVVGFDYVQLANMSAYGEPIGTMTVEGQVYRGELDVSSLLWSHDGGAIRGRGVYSAGGEIAGTVVVENFDPSVVRGYWPEIPDWHGRLNGDLTVSGTADNPSAEGQFRMDMIRAPGNAEPLGLTVDRLAVTYRDEVASVTGALAYEGVGIDLQGRVPVSAFADPPQDEAIVRLEMEPRELSGFRRFLGGVDLEQSRGLVQGVMEVRGTRAGQDVGGEFTFGPTADGEAAQLVVQGLDTVLQDVVLSLTGQEDALVLTGEAFSRRGGYVTLNGRAEIGGLLDGGVPDDLLGSVGVRGTVTFDEFRVGQTIGFTEVRRGAPVTIRADKESEATLYGSVEVGGTAGLPVVSGRVEMGGVLVNLPPEFPVGAESGEGMVTPRFENFSVVALTGSRVNLPVGAIQFAGTATVLGEGETLAARAPLRIEGGTLTVGTTRIQLEEGGTVNAVFGEALGGASVDVALTGTTRVTVREASDRYQSYRLTLNVRGDLLEPDGVVLTGESDPPGLSDDRIRAIVGQQDLIESLAATVLGQTGPNSLTESFYSLAVPNLTQGLTESLARTLRLDYLVLDYNPFDLGIIRAGATLGRGLTIEGSRQLQETEFGEIKWELRLAYQIPSSDRILSRTRLTLSTNETVPWRIGLDYSIRF